MLSLSSCLPPSTTSAFFLSGLLALHPETHYLEARTHETLSRDLGIRERSSRSTKFAHAGGPRPSFQYILLRRWLFAIAYNHFYCQCGCTGIFRIATLWSFVSGSSRKHCMGWLALQIEARRTRHASHFRKSDRYASIALHRGKGGLRLSIYTRAYVVLAERSRASCRITDTAIFLGDVHNAIADIFAIGLRIITLTHFIQSNARSAQPDET